MIIILMTIISYEELSNSQKDGGFSLIEYDVFFGSIQISNHLRLEGVKLYNHCDF